MIQELRKIQVNWGLSASELAQIAHVDEAVLQKYLQLKTVELVGLPTIPAGLENAVPLISIDRALQTLRPSVEEKNDWLRTPNTILENQIPIQVMMMSPHHLSWVSYTLDAALRFGK